MGRKSAETIGEILHFVGVRVLCTGAGILRPTLVSLDDVHTFTCPTFTLAATTNREGTILTNYTDQYGQVELRTTAIDEVFKVSKIIVFVKPTAAEYART